MKSLKWYIYLVKYSREPTTQERRMLNNHIWDGAFPGTFPICEIWLPRKLTQVIDLIEVIGRGDIKIDSFKLVGTIAREKKEDKPIIKNVGEIAAKHLYEWIREKGYGEIIETLCDNGSPRGTGIVKSCSLEELRFPFLWWQYDRKQYELKEKQEYQPFYWRRVRALRRELAALEQQVDEYQKTKERREDIMSKIDTAWRESASNSGIYHDEIPTPTRNKSLWLRTAKTGLFEWENFHIVDFLYYPSC